MNKKLFLLLAIMPLYAADQPPTKSIRQIKDETRMVQYTITLFPDPEQYDDAKWRATVDEAAAIVQRAGADDLDGSELIDTVFKSLQNLHERRDGTSGIHGNITVSLSDGNCPEGGCNNPCACKEEYRGLCPCSLDTTRTCRKVSPCSCASRAEGCQCPEGSCCKTNK